MTHYLAIDPQQEPFDIGLDDSGRIQYSVNFLSQMRPSPAFLREIVAVLVAAGVGIEGQNIFGSSLASIPSGPGPILSIRATGGTPPIGTHNDGAGAYRRPSVQIIVGAAIEEQAFAMAQAAYDALIAVRNQAVSA